jgi:hypothetical protein
MCVNGGFAGANGWNIHGADPAQAYLHASIPIILSTGNSGRHCAEFGLRTGRPEPCLKRIPRHRISTHDA